MVNLVIYWKDKIFNLFINNNNNLCPKIVQMLNKENISFDAFNILEDEEV